MKDEPATLGYESPNPERGREVRRLWYRRFARRFAKALVLVLVVAGLAYAGRRGWQAYQEHRERRQARLDRELHRAVERLDLAAVHKLLSAGARADAVRLEPPSPPGLADRPRHGRYHVLTPLAALAMNDESGDHVGVARALLAQGAPPGGRGGDCSPLWHAVNARNDALALHLLSAGAPSGGRCTYISHHARWTLSGPDDPLAIHLATCRPVVLAAMIARGDDVNAVTVAGGTTPLHAAAALCDDVPEAVESIRLLLGAGAKVNARDADGHTPLDYVEWTLARLARSGGVRATGLPVDADTGDADAVRLLNAGRHPAEKRAADILKAAGGTR